MATSSLRLLQPTSKRQRLLRVFAIFVVTVVLCVFLDDASFSPLERFADNMRVTAYYSRGHDSFLKWARDHIVVVTRSDDSFDDLRGQPLPRAYHAKLIRDLTRAGVKVIAFDFLFSSSKPEDDELAAAAKASGRVVWAGVLEDSDPGSGKTPKWTLPNEKLRQASPLVGHILAPLDQEISQVTRVPASLENGPSRIPAFSIQIARRVLGLQDEEIKQKAREIQFGSLRIPLDGSGNFLIKYLGSKPGQVFEPIPYETIYGGAVDNPFYRDNHFFRDKIVLVGDVTRMGNDHRPTPLGEMAGVEIHAQAVATLLQDSFFETAPPWINIALIAAFAGLTCFLVALGRAPIALLGTIALSVGQAFLNLALFADYGIVTHLVAPSVAILFATLGTLLERSLTVEREKHRAQALLQRYLSPQTANYVLQNPDKCLLGGERVEATVLFSDIRGFTALSESMEPEEVLNRLNEYFDAMTKTVFKHDGAVDKYIGDAIMAIFGAPVPHHDHARRAVAAALDMQTALLELQEKWKREGLPSIDIGIGINTGKMVFGNMGASDRVDLSVLGDSVNLASRVEGLNKELGTRILITDATYLSLGDELKVRGPIAANVKGKSEDVTVYEVFDWKGSEN